MIIPFLQSKQAARMRVGARGEDCASSYLQALGYKMYGRNVRVGRDEIDIIAWDPGDRVMVFAEVKTRFHRDIDYLPELNVTSAKKKKMHRAASTWVDRKQYEGSWRLDVITVVGSAIENHYAL